MVPQSDRASPRQYLRGLLGFADLGHIHDQVGFLDMFKYVSVWQRGLMLSFSARIISSHHVHRNHFLPSIQLTTSLAVEVQQSIYYEVWRPRRLFFLILASLPGLSTSPSRAEMFSLVLAPSRSRCPLLVLFPFPTNEYMQCFCFA